MTSIGIIGYGTFGRFMAAHLKAYADIKVSSRYDQAHVDGIDFVSLVIAAAQPIVILAMPVQYMEAVLIEIAALLKPGALVIDVASVKQLPIELMQKHVPESCHILATHPLFGPQSAKNGIAELPIVMCPVRIEDGDYAKLKTFLSDKLKLRVIEVSAIEHDAEMAYVQGLTFFIGQALARMDIPNTPITTKTYQHLLSIESIVKSDTADLFETIELSNPQARAVREELIVHLEQIEVELQDKLASK